MNALKPGFLSKKGGRWRPVRLLDLAILLYNAYKANEQPDIGFQDINHTLDSISKKLNQRILLDPAQLESLLWCSNMLHEDEKWTHPTGLSFDEFLKRLTPDGKFDRSYNIMSWKDGENYD